MAGDIGDADLYPTPGREAWARSKARGTPAATSCSISPPSPASTRPIALGHRRGGTGQGQRLAAAGRREAVRPRPGQRARTERRVCTKSSTKSEVYRIDHYLGKETVQNILAFRFGNGIFEPLWNRRYVNHVQITAAESIGVEGRGAYYQEAGALRDMIQNHLLQVMATIAMEPSAQFSSRPRCATSAPSCCARSASMTPEEVPLNAVPGQYGPARIGGSDVPGLPPGAGRRPELADRHLRRRARSSSTTGAGRACRSTSAPASGCPSASREIAIQFNSAPLHLFNQDENGASAPNLLILAIRT